MGIALVEIKAVVKPHLSKIVRHFVIHSIHSNNKVLKGYYHRVGGIVRWQFSTASMVLDIASIEELIQDAGNIIVVVTDTSKKCHCASARGTVRERLIRQNNDGSRSGSVVEGRSE